MQSYLSAVYTLTSKDLTNTEMYKKKYKWYNTKQWMMKQFFINDVSHDAVPLK